MNIFEVLVKHGGFFMAKESKHRRTDKKKPVMSLKEKRIKKHDKVRARGEPSEMSREF